MVNIGRNLGRWGSVSATFGQMLDNLGARLDRWGELSGDYGDGMVHGRQSLMSWNSAWTKGAHISVSGDITFLLVPISAARPIFDLEQLSAVPVSGQANRTYSETTQAYTPGNLFESSRVADNFDEHLPEFGQMWPTLAKL